MTLSQRAEQLQQGLTSANRLSNDASNVLDKLEKQLQALNKLTAPIFEKATSLTWAEQNIAEARTATEELLQFLGTTHRVRMHACTAKHPSANQPLESGSAL